MNSYIYNTVIGEEVDSFLKELKSRFMNLTVFDETKDNKNCKVLTFTKSSRSVRVQNFSPTFQTITHDQPFFESCILASKQVMIREINNTLIDFEIELLKQKLYK